MEMPTEHKIWAVVQAIQEAMAMAGAVTNLEIDPKGLRKYLTDADIRMIFTRLERLEHVITIYNLPGSATDGIPDLFPSGDPKTIRFGVTDEQAFRAFYNKTHFEFFGSLEKLSAVNFFAVLDVVQDIHEELEMSSSNEVTIPIKQALVRFPILYPVHTPEMMNRYCDMRAKAALYLKEHGYILSYEITREGWDSTITITLDRLTFTQFLTRLLEVKHERVSPGEAATSTEQHGTFRFSDGVLRRDGTDAIEKFGENSHEHSVLRVSFDNPPKTRIDNATSGIDMGWNALYDAARRLNEKIEKKFGVKGFFRTEFKDKYIERAV